jgi:predicted Fe-S protein YdhL (DUF1289 family)
MTVQSPCIDICKLDGETGFCIGCLRTREEIREWKGMTDHRRLQVIDECSRRPVQRQSEPPAARASEPAAQSD